MGENADGNSEDSLLLLKSRLGSSFLTPSPSTSGLMPDKGILINIHEEKKKSAKASTKINMKKKLFNMVAKS